MVEPSWPPRVVLEKIARHIAGEIVMSESPGSVLRKWREIFAASQLDVARHMGVTPSVVSDYEKGRRTPGSQFIRRFVEALLEIDSERGWSVVSHLAKMLQLNYLGAVIDMREFESGVELEKVVTSVKGFPVNSYLLNERIYGYTVVDSLRAIMSLSGSEFLHLLGSTTQRVIVFTRVTTGRSPMIALRVSTIKPAAIVLHGPRKLDYLALWMAESERVPVILSLAKSVDELVSGLRQLASSPR
ncbi:helix-turn-helix domain-containing protein [Pyrodictium occultum]|uniref:helix-turn-helix domain-containing protein n=1 Tax=Pyrodictium occultum TaxID=2309 RepID=UPI000AFB5B23|nr:helix-turn-helix domain-containing protein [Pyrodictium occultum]